MILPCMIPETLFHCVGIAAVAEHDTHAESLQMIDGDFHRLDQVFGKVSSLRPDHPTVQRRAGNGRHLADQVVDGTAIVIIAPKPWVVDLGENDINHLPLCVSHNEMFLDFAVIQLICIGSNGGKERKDQ